MTFFLLLFLFFFFYFNPIFHSNLVNIFIHSAQCHNFIITVIMSTPWLVVTCVVIYRNWFNLPCPLVSWYGSVGRKKIILNLQKFNDVHFVTRCKASMAGRVKLHSPLQLRCGKLQCPNRRVCTNFRTAVQQQSSINFKLRYRRLRWVAVDK